MDGPYLGLGKKCWDVFSKKATESDEIFTFDLTVTTYR